MDYRILGPFEAFDGERQLSLGGARQRAVLALLLLHANETVARDVIVDELWRDEAPTTAGKVVQNCVSALRKELPRGSETLRTFGGAYGLVVEPGELDRDRFERLFAEGRAALAAGDSADAAQRLRDALALFRGSPLSDFAYERFAQDEIKRLEELQVAALEDRIDADLALGRQAELVPELEALVHRHPLRERLRSQLMLALYRAGRQAEALEAKRDARRDLPDTGADDDSARFLFFEAMTDALRAEAAQQPLLLVLDDLQAADEESLLLLEFVASELPEMAALVLALGRENTARLDELARLATRTLQLEPR